MRDCFFHSKCSYCLACFRRSGTVFFSSPCLGSQSNARNKRTDSRESCINGTCVTNN